MKGSFRTFFVLNDPFMTCPGRILSGSGATIPPMTATKLVRAQSLLLEHSSHGVITAWRLEQLGVPQRTTYRRCQPGGPWTHLLPGIVLLSRTPPTTRQRIEAALMHCDRRGMVTGFEALRFYGLAPAPKTRAVHVLVPEDHKFTSANFTIVERTKHFPAPVSLDGVPLAPPHRAVLDGLRRVRDFDLVSATLLEALESGLCTHHDLVAELDSGSRRGTALPRSVLRRLVDDVRSVPELDAVALWRSAGLPDPLCNVKLFDRDGRFIAMADLWDDEVALAWEIDSWEFHQKGELFKKTIERNNRYAASGIVVVQTLPSKLRSDPKAVVSELRAARKWAASRPRPAVTVVPARKRSA
ncbi:hypothetical protein AB0N89_10690 [Amycolatopsis sp. NPDC089917]|uniref:hypothetical protein n=1 Tax=Amycolatopsis sp. NPDC089917 TaxID=3155187 RepID=UPI0034142223